MELGKLCYESDAEIRLAEHFISENMDQQDLSVFHSACRVIKSLNEALINSDEEANEVIKYLKLTYDTNFCVDGCYHPAIERMFHALLDSNISDSQVLEIEEEFESTELVLFMSDDLLEYLD